MPLSFDHPGIETGESHPLLDPCEPIGSAVLPVAEQLGDSAGDEPRLDILDDGCHDSIPDHPAIAVFVGGHAVLATRSDHEWRVRHDMTEFLAEHRVEQAAETQLDVRDAVELGIEGREFERSHRDIRSDHPGGVTGGMEGLDSATRAEIESEIDGL